MVSNGSRQRVKLGERDFAVLAELLHCRFSTLPHLAALFFNGSEEAAKKRLQSLKGAGLVNQKPRRPGEIGIQQLTEAGYQELQRQGLLGGFPPLSRGYLGRRARVSELTLKHEQEVLDLKV